MLGQTEPKILSLVQIYPSFMKPLEWHSIEMNLAKLLTRTSSSSAMRMVLKTAAPQFASRDRSGRGPGGTGLWRPTTTGATNWPRSRITKRDNGSSYNAMCCVIIAQCQRQPWGGPHPRKGWISKYVSLRGATDAGLKTIDTQAGFTTQRFS